MFIKISQFTAISLAAVFALSGCSVKPEVMKQEEVRQMVKDDLELLSQVVEPVSKPITLDEAIQRGLKYNLHKRVKMLEVALSEQQLDLVYYDMLPSLTASAGYSERSNYAAAQSVRFENGKPTALTGEYAVSQQLERPTADLTFSWNVLDFGLSYVRAQQQADKLLIAKEKQKKVEHNLTQEIRRAYYQAVSAEDLLARIQPMMVEVKQALKDSKEIQKQRLTKSPMEALSYQRELLDILRSLHTLESALISSKVELAELMGLKPGIEFALAEKVEKNYAVPGLKMELAELERLALENRPELAESRYQVRISEKEIKAAKLRLLPNLNLMSSLSTEDSRYLLNNDWYSYGANVSWNLLNVFKAGEMNKIAKTQVEIAKEQKLALSMAVLSQVHLSLVKFHQARKEYLLAKEYMGVADDIYTMTKRENELNVQSRLVLIKERLNNILATLRYSSSYANMQNSYGRIFASLGVEKEVLGDALTMQTVVEETPEPIKPLESAQTQTATAGAVPVAKDSPTELPKVQKQEQQEVIEDETKIIEENIFDKNLYDAQITLYAGEKLRINGEEYKVEADDTFSGLARKNGLHIKELLIENFWLVEQDRVEFK